MISRMHVACTLVYAAATSTVVKAVWLTSVLQIGCSLIAFTDTTEVLPWLCLQLYFLLFVFNVLGTNRRPTDRIQYIKPH